MRFTLRTNGCFFYVFCLHVLKFLSFLRDMEDCLLCMFLSMLNHGANMGDAGLNLTCPLIYPIKRNINIDFLNYHGLITSMLIYRTYMKFYQQRLPSQSHVLTLSGVHYVMQLVFEGVRPILVHLHAKETNLSWPINSICFNTHKVSYYNDFLCYMFSRSLMYFCPRYLIRWQLSSW